MKPPAADVTVRPARADDGPAMAAAEAETARTPGLLVQRPGEIPLGAYTEKIAALADAGRYLVAEEEGRIVGHALLEPLPLAATRHVFQLTIVVHPGSTGRGIGRALLTELLAWAAGDARVGKIELRVRAGNERAIRLYRSLGFEDEGRFARRVRLPDGVEVDDLAMAWFPDRTGANVAAAEPGRPTPMGAADARPPGASVPPVSAPIRGSRRVLTASWGDMDFNRHMGNAAYLDLCTTVRMMHFADHGVAMADFDRLRVGPVVLRDEIEYFREIRMLERIEVGLELLGASPDGSHFRLRNEIWRSDGQRAAQLVSTGGWLDVDARKLVVPPAAILAALEAIPRSPSYEALPSLRKAGRP